MVLVKIEQTDGGMVARAEKNKLAYNIRGLLKMSGFKVLDNDYDTFIVFCDRFSWEQFYYDRVDWFVNQHKALFIVEHLRSIGETKLAGLARYVC
jgi:hypothetical protein